MELEDVQSDLQALKKLYGLLQFQGNNPQKNAASPNLDEKAKLVLKKLLDRATKQIISEEQQSVETVSEDHLPKLQSPVPPDTLSKASPPIDAISKVSDKDTSFNPITSQTRKRCRICGKNRDRDHRRNRNSSDHHHGVNSSTRPPINGIEMKESAKGIDYTKKPKLNKIHDVKCNKEMWFKSEPAGYKSFEQNGIKKPEKTVTDFVQRIGARTNGLDKDLFATKHKSKDMMKEEDVENNGTGQDNRPVGVAEAIRRIEARIRANQQMLSHRVVDSVKDKKGIESKHQPSKISQLLEMKDGSSQKNVLSHLASEKDLNHKDTSNALPPNMVTSRTRNNLSNRSTSEIEKTKKDTSMMDQKPFQKPYRFTAGMNDSPPIQMDGRAKKSILPGPPSQKKCSQTGRKPIRERNELPNHKTSLTDKSVLGRVTTPSQKTKESTFLPTQMLTQTNSKTRGDSQRKTGPAGTNVLPRVVGPTPVKAHLAVGRPPPLKKDLTRAMTTTSQQRRAPLDVNHKLLSRTREYDKPRQHIILPTLLNETYRNAHPADPPKKQMTYQQNRRKPMSPVSSESESESASTSTSASYSTASDSTTQEGSSSNSCSESDSDPQPRRMNTSQQTGPTSRYRSSNVSQTRERSRSVEHKPMVGMSRHVGSTAITKSSNRKPSEKEVGRLRRFKNKLGIIFHHHHHHHHHHHDAADEVGTATSDHHRSLWRYLGDILHHRTNSKDNGRKSMVKNKPRQNQHGYLHTLVDGFIRHVRHSKKSKKSEADIKRLGTNSSRKKKKAVVKKWHWWQKLRGNSSNSGKTRVKVGFRAKRPLLRAPKPN